MNMSQYSTECETDLLEEFVTRVDELHPKVTRIIEAQQDICGSLIRTAEALRALARVTH